MPYVAPVTGYTDRLGYARCIPCHDATERAADMAILADNSAFHGEACDSCRRPFPVRRLVDWQPVEISARR